MFAGLNATVFLQAAEIGLVLYCSSRTPAEPILVCCDALRTSRPFMLFFVTLVAAKVEGGLASLFQFIVEQLGYGFLVGLGIGWFGGRLLGLARRKGGRDTPLCRSVCSPTARLHGDLRVGGCQHVHRILRGGPRRPGRIQRSWEAQRRVC